MMEERAGKHASHQLSDVEDRGDGGTNPPQRLHSQFDTGNAALFRLPSPSGWLVDRPLRQTGAWRQERVARVPLLYLIQARCRCQDATTRPLPR